MEANYFDALDHVAQRLAERRNDHPEYHSGDFIKFLRDAYGIRKAQAPEDLGKGMIWRLDNNAKALFLSGDARVEPAVLDRSRHRPPGTAREHRAADQTGTIKQ
ncbi:hypothetical protein ACNJYA_10525 [Bradyrhizobium sp. DASA03068]|uniref:hypothetical protein n=1 Tax=Bradyrhizobium sp. BLXBL-01 TaxID=3395915 RepID=UPI003F713045